MNKFLIGFAVGTAIGVAVVILTAPRSGEAVRGSFGEAVRGALEAGRAASASRERAMWSDFRARLARTTPPASEGLASA